MSAETRSPKELGELGVFRKNYDYGESPYSGKPVDIKKFRKRKRKLRRIALLNYIMENL
jgi:hypothetical protein